MKLPEPLALSKQLLAGASSRFFHRILMMRRPSQGLLVAAFPKSASTFFASALALAIGARIVDCSGTQAGPGRRGFFKFPDLSRTDLLKLGTENHVIHQHVISSSHNDELITGRNLRCIVSTRNLLDCIVSLDEHLFRERLSLNFAFIPAHYRKLPSEERYDFLMQQAVPWYFNFLSGWLTFPDQRQLYWTNYERITGDPAEEVARALRFFDMEDVPLDADEISALRGHRTRFNKGVSGRGRELLSKEQIAKVYSMSKIAQLPELARGLVGLTEMAE